MADELNYESEEYLDESQNESATKTQKRRKQAARRVEDSWKDDDVTLLIAEVETHPCLWDARNEGYKNKTSRETAWRDISETFGNKITMQQLNIKWQLLRNAFRNASSKAKKTKSGQGVETTPQWKFHSHMAFVTAAEKAQNVVSVSNLDSVSNCNKVFQ